MFLSHQKTDRLRTTAATKVTVLRDSVTPMSLVTNVLHLKLLHVLMMPSIKVLSMVCRSVF